MDGGMGIMGGCNQTMPSCIDVSPTMLQKLQREKSRLEEKLARVNAGIDVLEKDPTLAGALETLRQAM